MSFKQTFQIVTLDDVRGEDRVQARISQWPERTYKEDELKKLANHCCIPMSIKDAAFEARLAVVSEKARQGFLSKRHKYVAVPALSKPKVIPVVKDTQAATAPESPMNTSRFRGDGEYTC